jgi:hypothetical protein
VSCLAPEEKKTSQTVNDQVGAINDQVDTINDHISTLLTNEKADEDDSQLS